MNRKLFISSCSQRQLARRRRGVNGRWLTRGAYWRHALMLSLVIAVAAGAFVAGRGGL
jgi:hypothetical protein